MALEAFLYLNELFSFELAAFNSPASRTDVTTSEDWFVTVLKLNFPKPQTSRHVRHSEGDNNLLTDTSTSCFQDCRHPPGNHRFVFLGRRRRPGKRRPLRFCIVPITLRKSSKSSCDHQLQHQECRQRVAFELFPQEHRLHSRERLHLNRRWLHVHTSFKHRSCTQMATNKKIARMATSLPSTETVHVCESHTSTLCSSQLLPGAPISHLDVVAAVHGSVQPNKSTKYNVDIMIHSAAATLHGPPGPESTLRSPSGGMWTLDGRMGLHLESRSEEIKVTFDVTHVVRPIISFVSLNDRAKSVVTQQQDHTSTAGPGGVRR